jgi:hypothetical protein
MALTAARATEPSTEEQSAMADALEWLLIRVRPAQLAASKPA